MNQIIRAGYTSDNGNLYVTGLDSEVAAQLDGLAASKVGYAGNPPAGTDPLPRQMRPRRAVMFNPAGRRREVIILSPAAPLATIGETLNLEDSDGAATVYTVDQVKSETSRRRRKVAAV